MAAVKNSPKDPRKNAQNQSFVWAEFIQCAGRPHPRLRCQAPGHSTNPAFHRSDGNGLPRRMRHDARPRTRLLSRPGPVNAGDSASRPVPSPRVRIPDRPSRASHPQIPGEADYGRACVPQRPPAGSGSCAAIWRIRHSRRYGPDGRAGLPGPRTKRPAPRCPRATRRAASIRSISAVRPVVTQPAGRRGLQPSRRAHRPGSRPPARCGWARAPGCAPIPPRRGSCRRRGRRAGARWSSPCLLAAAAGRLGPRRPRRSRGPGLQPV